MRWGPVVVLVACGGAAAHHDAGVSDGPLDARRDAPVDAPSADVAPDGAPATALNVKNYQGWCAVSVDAEGYSVATDQTVFVQPGMIALVARPGSAYTLGSDMWHHVDSDLGSGASGSQTGSGSSAQSSAVVTVRGMPVCVWVCCPMNLGSGSGANGCSGLADQCP